MENVSNIKAQISHFSRTNQFGAQLWGYENILHEGMEWFRRISSEKCWKIILNDSVWVKNWKIVTKFNVKIEMCILCGCLNFFIKVKPCGCRLEHTLHGTRIKEHKNCRKKHKIMEIYKIFVDNLKLLALLSFLFNFYTRILQKNSSFSSKTWRESKTLTYTVRLSRIKRT